MEPRLCCCHSFKACTFSWVFQNPDAVQLLPCSEMFVRKKKRRRKKRKDLVLMFGEAPRVVSLCMVCGMSANIFCKGVPLWCWLMTHLSWVLLEMAVWNFVRVQPRTGLGSAGIYSGEKVVSEHQLGELTVDEVWGMTSNKSISAEIDILFSWELHWRVVKFKHFDFLCLFWIMNKSFASWWAWNIVEKEKRTLISYCYCYFSETFS